MLCPVLVGRDDELGALDDGLSAVRHGRGGRMVFVTGEAGIGKSRVCREVGRRARDGGMRVVVGRAVPTGVGAPYRPLTEALLQTLRERPWPADPELTPWLPALAAIVPVPGVGVARRGAAVETSTTVRGEALLRLLRLLAAPAGLVLVIEDLHWADPDTLGVLEYLGDNLADVAVLCLVTCRTEAAGSGAAADMVRRLRSRHAAAELPLRRLTSSEMAAMVRACLPDADDTTTVRVQRVADGVPLLVEEVLASPGVPASLRQSVAARLAGLPPDERAVIAAAAVLGRTFDWRLLASVSGRPDDVVARALESGLANQLLAVDGDTFRFRHALTREAVVDTLLPPRRADLAAAALRAVHEAYPELSGPVRDAVAELAVQAGDYERAGALLAAAGVEALDSGALATAATTLRRAAAMMAPGQRRVDAESRLVEALALAGRFDEAAAVGVALAAQLPDGAARAHVHVELANAAVAATRWAAAREHVTAAAALAAGDAPVLAQVSVVRAEVALADGDGAAARSLATSLLDVPALPADLRCHAYEIVGRSLRLRDLEAAREAFEQALAVAEHTDLPVWRLRALHELGTIELFQHAGSDGLRRARRIATDIGALSTVAVLDLQLAAAGHCRFDLDEAAGHARDCLALSERLGLDRIRAKALYFLAENLALRVDAEQSERHLARALAAGAGDPVMEGFGWGGCRGMLALLGGDRRGALAALERAAAILRDHPHAEPANFRGVWPLLLAATGDDRADAEIERARSLGITVAYANRGMLGYAEAVLAGRRGDPDRAGALAATAHGHLAAYPVWSHLARLLAAPAAIADGWGEPAAWLEQGHACFSERGLRRLADECTATLPRRAPVAGMTTREAEVFELLAEGLPNRDIAARLHLSPRTVEKHVESLLRKSGTRSRTHLVALAGRSAGSTA